MPKLDFFYQGDRKQTQGPKADWAPAGERILPMRLADMVSFQRLCVLAVTHTVYIGIAALIILELVRRARESHGAGSIAVLSLVLIAWVAAGVCIPWSVFDPHRNTMPWCCGSGSGGRDGNTNSEATPPDSTVEEQDQVQARSREQAAGDAVAAAVHVPAAAAGHQAGPLDPRGLPAV